MTNTFQDLRVWQEAYKLALQIYKFTDTFPKSELYALSSQLRRAAVSVTSNIAEGYGRFSKADKEHFYVMAAGSLFEIKSQLLIAVGLGYINQSSFNDLEALTDSTHKALNGLLKVHKNSDF